MRSVTTREHYLGIRKLILIILIIILFISSVGGGKNTASQSSAVESVDPIMYWNFEEGTGSTAEDIIGGHNGTINGANWERSSIIGDFALDFEESEDDHIVVTDHDDLSFGNGLEDRAFSLSAWIYREADTEYGNIICKYDNVNDYREWIFYINGPSKRLIFTLHDESTDGYISASAYYGGSGTYLVANTLYHVAATYDGSGSENGLTVWVNGTDDTVTRESANYIAMENMGEPVRIGKQGEQTTRSFDGIMDDVRIYDIELSKNDLEDIMNDDPSYGNPSFEYLINGDFEADNVGILSPWSSVTGWDGSSNGGTAEIITGKALKMTNADSTSDYGTFEQTFAFTYDESKDYIFSGKSRLVLDGTSWDQGVFVSIALLDSLDIVIVELIIYMRADYQSYTNTSTQSIINLSPYPANDPLWGSNPDTGWISFEYDVDEYLNTIESLNSISERVNIASIRFVIQEYTNYDTATSAYFDDMSFRDGNNNPYITTERQSSTLPQNLIPLIGLLLIMGIVVIMVILPRRSTRRQTTFSPSTPRTRRIPSAPIRTNIPRSPIPPKTTIPLKKTRTLLDFWGFEMKYCTKCGAENPDVGLFCMGCGERFPQEMTGTTPSVPTSPSSAYQQSHTSIPTERRPASEIPPVREEYGHIIFDSSYNYLVIGSLAFALSPLLAIALGVFFVLTDPQGSFDLTLFVNLIELVCFGLFVFGIYSISRLEHSSLYDQLRNVPAFLSIYLIANLVTTSLFDKIPDIDPSATFDELRGFVLQGIGILGLHTIITIFLLLGALKFTTWFENFVTMLRAPYNAPTTRFKWFAISIFISRGFLMLSFFMLLSALDNLSFTAIGDANFLISLGAIAIFIALILQILSGYKIYSVLNNIRQGKYDGTYQHQILQKYYSNNKIEKIKIGNKSFESPPPPVLEITVEPIILNRVQDIVEKVHNLDLENPEIKKWDDWFRRMYKDYKTRKMDRDNFIKTIDKYEEFLLNLKD